MKKEKYLVPDITTLLLNIESSVMLIVSGNGASADLDIVDDTSEEDWVY